MKVGADGLTVPASGGFVEGSSDAEDGAQNHSKAEDVSLFAQGGGKRRRRKRGVEEFRGEEKFEVGLQIAVVVVSHALQEAPASSGYLGVLGWFVGEEEVEGRDGPVGKLGSPPGVEQALLDVQGCHGQLVRVQEQQSAAQLSSKRVTATDSDGQVLVAKQVCHAALGAGLLHVEVL